MVMSTGQTKDTQGRQSVSVSHWVESLYCYFVVSFWVLFQLAETLSYLVYFLLLGKKPPKTSWNSLAALNDLKYPRNKALYGSAVVGYSPWSCLITCLHFEALCNLHILENLNLKQLFQNLLQNTVISCKNLDKIRLSCSKTFGKLCLLLQWKINSHLRIIYYQF